MVSRSRPVFVEIISVFEVEHCVELTLYRVDLSMAMSTFGGGSL